MTSDDFPEGVDMRLTWGTKVDLDLLCPQSRRRRFRCSRRTWLCVHAGAHAGVPGHVAGEKRVPLVSRPGTAPGSVESKKPPSAQVARCSGPPCSPCVSPCLPRRTAAAKQAPKPRHLRIFLRRPVVAGRCALFVGVGVHDPEGVAH